MQIKNHLEELKLEVESTYGALPDDLLEDKEGSAAAPPSCTTFRFLNSKSDGH